MHIEIDLTKARLILFENESNKSKILMDVSIVSGCQGSESLVGKYKAGKFKEDKTNSKYGAVPWSKNKWENPYGPYFLPILTLKGSYTYYGIHGTRGYGWLPFVTPPIPERLLKIFIDDTKFLYCSHGCIRISNRDIQQLFEKLTFSSKLLQGPLFIFITK